MPQYFSQAPIDRGAGYWAQAGQSVSNTFNGLTQQLLQQAAQKDMLTQQQQGQTDLTKLEASIREAQRQAELERSIDSEGWRVGVTPIFGPDGKKDLPATIAAIQKAKDTRERLQKIADANSQHSLQTGWDAAALGIKQNPKAPAFAPSAQPFGSTSTSILDQSKPAEPFSAQTPGVPLERQIYLAKQEQERQKLAADQRVRSDAASDIDPAAVRTAKYRAGLAQNLRSLASQRATFLDNGQEVPADLADKFSRSISEYNALGRMGEANDPTVMDVVQEFSRKPLPVSQVDKLNTGLSTVKQAARALDSMENAVDILGGGQKGIDALRQYSGLGYTQARELVSKFQIPDEQKAAVLDAIQGIEQVRAAVRYGLYAGNLTESEAAKFDLQAGGVNNKDYFDRTRTFLKNTYEKENDRLNALDKEYYVPKGIRSGFNEARGGIYRDSRTGAVSGPQAPQAIKINAIRRTR